jgi:hypothetical protein
LKLRKRINKSGSQAYLLLAALQIAILLAAPTLGQSTADPEPQLGSIAGTVTDPNDQVVPAATVTLDSPASGNRDSVVANDYGFFALQVVSSQEFHMK